jgi:outer membrane protein assembly factor BamB
MMRAGIGGGFLILAAASLSAADWTQFRGRDGTGVSEETGLPIRWDRTENIRWKAALPGRGLSSPVISKGRVYVTACSGPWQDRLHVLCFNVADGRKVWERQFWSTGNTLCHPKTCMAAPTPATNGDHVYALFATGDLVGLDSKGDLLWYRSLGRDYPTVGNNVGMAASPVLWKNVLILAMENAGESFACGIDAKTGRNVWKVERNRDINWVTPLVVSGRNGDEVLLQSGKEISGYNPQTGEKRWTYEHAGLSTIPSPVSDGSLVLTPAGDQFLALRSSTPGIKPTLAWKSTKLKSAFASPVAYQDRVYAVNQTGVVNCVDAADGKLLWQSPRLTGPFAASPVAGEGRLYLVNEQGNTSVLQVGAEPRVLSTNVLDDPMLASPAISGGAIYLRSDKHLYCIAERSAALH